MPSTNSKWDSLWLNAKLMGCVDGQGPLGQMSNAAIAIQGDSIAWIGPQNTLPAEPERLAHTVHNVEGQWITPGLIDCHTHLVYAGQRANEFAMRLQGMSYADIAKAGGGIKNTVAATRAASEAELYTMSEQRLQALLREGVTCLEIKSGYGLDLETELKMLRVAKQLAQHYPVTIRTTFLGAHTIPAEYSGRANAYIDFVCEEVLPRVAEEQLADAVDGFCESIAFTPAQIEKVFMSAQDLGLPVKLHAEQLTDQGGAGLAARYQALSADHLEFVSEQSVVAMADAGTVAVLLPGAYYFLAETHKPPIDLLRQHHVPIAIATDCNPGSSPVTSLLLMLNMGCTLFNLTTDEALLGVTQHAAKALGLENSMGHLAPGYKANFVIWGINAVEELAYNIGFNPAKQIVYEGKLQTINKDDTL